MGELKNEPIEDLPEIKEGDEDTHDWKAIAQKNHGIAKRFQTKFNKLKTKKVEVKIEKQEPVKDKDKEGFDYAELAYLVAKGHSKKKEQDHAAKVMKDTGKSLKKVLDNKYFKAEIKEMREHADTAGATPKGTKRSTQTTRDKVDYWLAKGELPPKDQPKLRQEYVNAKVKAEGSGSKFAKHPVVE